MWMCFEVFQNAERLLRASPIHLAWKLTSLEKWQLVVSTLDKLFTKIGKQTQIFKESSVTIRIRMHCLVFILLTCEMCQLDVPDSVYWVHIFPLNNWA